MTARALRRLLRGGTWQALARELAWQAIRAGGGKNDWLEPLSASIDERLAMQIDGVEFAVERALLAAAGEHLERWPRDFPGAELCAVQKAADEALRLLAVTYADVLTWATDIVLERREFADERQVSPRFSRRSQERSRPSVALPALVADDLTRTRERFGWPL